MVSASANVNSLANNVNAAAEVFAKHGDFIRTVIRYQVGNKAQADDLFQDFFLSLVSKPVPSGIQNVKGYLYKAITNDIIDATRRVEKHRSHIHKYAKRLNSSTNRTNPEDVFIEEEETNRMFELIEMRLRHSEAQAITLKYGNNYDIKQVAKKMNVDSASVRRYVSVGFSKIRQFLTNSEVEC